MLVACSSLQELKLSVLTRNSQHIRILSERELLVPQPTPLFDDAAVNETTSPPSLAPTQIIAPAVRRLQMYGRWVLQDELLLRFLKGMFPGLIRVYEHGWSGISVKEWVGVFRAISETLRVVQTEMEAPNTEEMNGFGLCREDEMEDEDGEGKNVLLKAVAVLGMGRGIC